ncbi:MAG: DUF4160 domain-containing protein [Thermoflexales bacterium]|nr:DUF4160 domain-containing protein [Thermoflexales bacterium]
MPEISRFYGIIVFMNYRDHDPPHFHAGYQDYEITVEIQTGTVQGKMPKRALRMVLEWGEEHQDELMNNWQAARDGRRLEKIPPLV